jgi:hypothetical protein
VCGAAFIKSNHAQAIVDEERLCAVGADPIFEAEKIHEDCELKVVPD